MKKFALLLALLFALAPVARAQVVYSAPIRTFNVSEPVVDMDITPDGTRLAVADRDNVSVFNPESGYLIRVLENADKKLTSVRFWPDRDHVVYPARITSVSDGQKLKKFYYSLGSDSAYATSQNRQRLACFDADTIFIYTAETNYNMPIIATFNVSSETSFDRHDIAMDISPDNTRLAHAGQAGYVNVYNMNNGSRNAFRAHTDNINSVRFNPVDGNQALTASSDGTVRLWELTSSTLVRQFESRTGGIKTAVFSPDGNLVVAGCNDGRARAWETATGREVAVFYGHTQAVSCVAFTPDGKKLLTGSWDRTVRLWTAPAVFKPAPKRR